MSALDFAIFRTALQEIFAAVKARYDRPATKKLGKLGFDFGGAAIFNQQVQATAGEILNDKAVAMKNAGHELVTYFVRHDASLQECAKLMKTHGVGAVFSIDSHDSLVGIVTERDFVQFVSHSRKIDIRVSPHLK